MYIADMKINILHLIGWSLVYFFYRDILGNIVNYSPAKVWEALTGSPLGFALELSSIFIFLLAAVTSCLILKHTIPARKYLKAILLIVMLFPGLSLLRYLIEEVLYKAIFGSGNYYGDFSKIFYVLDNSYFTSGYVLIGCVYFLFRYALHNEKKNKDLIFENQKTELSFLKSQINPHFLFNSLNNLYSLIYHQSEKALPYVSKLSNLIRYSLYESHEKIALGKELDYLNDLIDLEKMRHQEDLSMNLEIQKGLEHIRIPPFTLIPFIENAFKHGDLKNEASPLSIELKKEGNDISFSVRNKIKQQQKDKTGGIGLNNLKKRLELLYGTNHYMDTTRQSDIFTAELKLIDIC